PPTVPAMIFSSTAGASLQPQPPPCERLVKRTPFSSVVMSRSPPRRFSGIETDCATSLTKTRQRGDERAIGGEIAHRASERGVHHLTPGVHGIRLHQLPPDPHVAPDEHALTGASVHDGQRDGHPAH